jgi:predicted transcriptional regulator
VGDTLWEEVGCCEKKLKTVEPTGGAKFMRRNKLEITLCILEAAKNGANKTKIVYESNLNFKSATQYLEFLTKNEFIQHDSNFYKTTEKGIDYIEKIKEVII